LGAASKFTLSKQLFKEPLSYAQVTLFADQQVVVVALLADVQVVTLLAAIIANAQDCTSNSCSLPC
jgi:hypothetical protein